MKTHGRKDAGNAAGFGVSTRCAGSPLRFDPAHHYCPVQLDLVCHKGMNI